MRYRLVAALASGVLASGCDGVVGPGDGEAVYALHRIGDAVLPTPAWQGPDAPLVLADRITIPASRGRPEASFVISRIQIFKEVSGRVDSSSGRFSASLQGDLLSVNNCPLGAFCAAVDLVYIPFVLRVAGDSLFEVVAEGSPLKPRVYGRVMAR
jgi:hypothetical protein